MQPFSPDQGSRSLFHSSSSQRILVHCSNSELGGAEISLLDLLGKDGASGESLEYILPGSGGLSKKLGDLGIPFQILPFPRILGSLTRADLWWQWILFPWMGLGLSLYLLRLLSLFSKSGRIFSSGIKSHLICLLLQSRLSGRIVYDIRDFIRPVWIRLLIDKISAWGHAEVRVNSHAVGRAYRKARVHYPLVKLTRPCKNRRTLNGKLIITHLAYFAPYKGQGYFLDLARKILDAGVNAEFWVVGDIIYSGGRYRRYKKDLIAKVENLGLNENVKFWGGMSSPKVQELLEQTHFLLHCTLEPEPFGRAVMEGLLCGCEVICHKASGVCEVLNSDRNYPRPLEFLRDMMPIDYVRVWKKAGDGSAIQPYSDGP